MTETPQSMIAGMGHAVPSKVLTNHDLEKMVDTNDQWIRERTGIERRHVLEKDKTNSDLAAQAGVSALQDAGMKPEEVDCIILATISGDMPFPSTACFVQAKLGAVNAAAFDVSAACSGFLYGLALADSFIRSNTFQRVLVIGSETLSRFVDWEDRATCVLFGDGAGAAVVVPSDGKKGIMASYIRSDGRLTHLLNTPGGGSTHPASHDTVDQHMHFIKMEGREVFKHAVRSMVDAIKHSLKQAKLRPEEIDFLVPHQANVRIIDAIAERLHMGRDQVCINVQNYGNTSAASIPIALDEARRDGRVHEGSTCLLVAFGGGLTWASAVIRF
jgi:3-oxoacyl-[acyl-carrier-protein] synthase-3